MLAGALSEQEYRRQSGFLEGAYAVVKMPERVAKELEERALERLEEKEAAAEADQ